MTLSIPQPVLLGRWDRYHPMASVASERSVGAGHDRCNILPAFTLQQDMVCTFLTFWVLLIIGADVLGLIKMAIAIAAFLALSAVAWCVDESAFFFAGTTALDTALLLTVSNGGVWIKRVVPVELDQSR